MERLRGMTKSKEILRKYWRYDEFRPLQEEIITSILEGRDTLALMPTGGGKSICFQVPAVQMEGICIVISPLIALMKDQVDQLKKRGINAVVIHSGMTAREIDIAFDNCIFGDIKLLYLSPERLYSDLAQERIRHMKVSFVAVDEAHCISEWGYDFRPAYLQIHILREWFPDIPIMALTATATKDVVQDIQEKLLFSKRKQVFIRSFKRDNLAYMVLEDENKLQRLLRIIRRVGGGGIVYVRNRRETKELASWLLNNGIPTGFYHAGLEMQERNQTQTHWLENKIRVIVATNAFGMGIDKPDVRFVVHWDVPDTLEAYFQEAGRAGRDQKKSFAVMLYTQKDVEKLHDNLEASFPDYTYIKQVYHHLCNYYQIPFGAGEGLEFDFDLVDFVKKYQLEVLSVLSTLKFLERDGWLSATEAVFVPSRFKFEVDFKELYKFQIAHAKYDSLIKAILRNYGGVFDNFVAINEYEYAKGLSVPYPVVVELLNSLQQFEICTYLPSSNAPKVRFLRSRVDYKHLHIDTQFISERKKIKSTQVRAVESYLEEKKCRSQYLLSYFGETESESCGVCDLCLVNKHKKKDLEKRIKKEIRNLLVNRDLDIHTLVDKIEAGDDAYKLKVIRALVEDESVVCKGQLYSWKVKK